MRIQISKDDIRQGYHIAHDLGYHSQIEVDIPVDQQGESLAVAVEIDGVFYGGALYPTQRP